MKKDYLDEDDDLIQELEAIKPEKAYAPSDKWNLQLAQLQGRILLRTRKTFRETSEQAHRFSWAIFIFTIVQVAIAMFAFILSLFPPETLKTRIVVFALFILFIVVLVIDGFREMDRTPKK